MSFPGRDESAIESVHVPGPPQFGHPSTWPSPASTPPVAPSPYRASTTSRVIVRAIAGAIAAVAIISVGWIVYRAATTGSHETVGDIREKVVAACHSGVIAQLKAPGAAKFVRDERLSILSETRQQVEGSVDAQNTFGAMIRTRYTCRADKDGADWKAVLVTFSE